MRTRQIELGYEICGLNPCQNTYTIYYLDNKNDLAEFIKTTFNIDCRRGVTLNDIPLHEEFIYYVEDSYDYPENVIVLVKDLIEGLKKDQIDISKYIYILESAGKENCE